MEIEQGIRQRRTGGKLRTDGKEVDDRSNKGVKQRFEVKKKSLLSDTLQKTLTGMKFAIDRNNKDEKQYLEKVRQLFSSLRKTNSTFGLRCSLDHKLRWSSNRGVNENRPRVSTRCFGLIRDEDETTQHSMDSPCGCRVHRVAGRGASTVPGTCDPSKVKGFADEIHEMWQEQGTEIYWEQTSFAPVRINTKR
ncbi:unnamed protein product [Danaus chrysippus]|uniref:(African queen) hypothetical protein n=1 Tax=Danaus chrysippus TaxID=151541 RepID=A0A8J2W3F8_9NEOP|nr:unnamed protein product [Danaus chrysippus]